MRFKIGDAMSMFHVDVLYDVFTPTSTQYRYTITINANYMLLLDISLRFAVVAHAQLLHAVYGLHMAMYGD